MRILLEGQSGHRMFVFRELHGLSKSLPSGCLLCHSRGDLVPSPKDPTLGLKKLEFCSRTSDLHSSTFNTACAIPWKDVQDTRPMNFANTEKSNLIQLYQYLNIS